jgi:hypothetical protein
MTITLSNGGLVCLCFFGAFLLIGWVALLLFVDEVSKRR